MQEYYIASVSWGKDSLYMLLRLMEERAPLNEVVFYDTGMEFQAIYETRDKVLAMLAERGIEYSELKPKRPFIYDMLEKPVKGKNGFRLYDLLDRVSCWCCANKNIKELRNIYAYLPEYWERLKEIQRRTERPMKGEGKSVFELDARFGAEIVIEKE